MFEFLADQITAQGFWIGWAICSAAGIALALWLRPSIDK
jgi:hypothetical protein